jgi:hypothetical protein
MEQAKLCKRLHTASLLGGVYLMCVGVWLRGVALTVYRQGGDVGDITDCNTASDLTGLVWKKVGVFTVLVLKKLPSVLGEVLHHDRVSRHPLDVGDPTEFFGAH